MSMVENYLELVAGELWEFVPMSHQRAEHSFPIAFKASFEYYIRFVSNWLTALVIRPYSDTMLRKSDGSSYSNS